MAGIKHVDLLIVGAGMVGASLLCALQPAIRKQGLKVAVIEAFPLPDRSGDLSQPSYDARSTALSWGSSNILRKIGVWDQLRSRVTPIERIHVSDKGHFGSVRMAADEYGVEALGYVVENSWLGQVLLRRIESQANLNYYCPARVVDLQPGDDGALVVIEEQGKQRKIKARLAVIADGGRSGLTEKLAVQFDQHEYHQQAIIANVTVQQTHKNIAYERFTSDGPIALLPLLEEGVPVHDQRRCSLVLSVDKTRVDAVMAMNDGVFLDHLQQRFGYRLGRFEKVGERFSYPLSLQWAKQPYRPGVVMVGNAAHTLHPVAGQGFNLALRGVDELANLLIGALADGVSPGDAALLKQYAELRHKDQMQTIRFTDLTVRLFSNNDWLLSRLRDFGLVAMDLLPVSKMLFAHQAMGFKQSRSAYSRLENTP